ncbi:MAG: ABC transporter permease [Sphingobacteriia bacterium]|nr:MAG: ABC transporter permease [Sphingobacteriia bacterium]TAG31586.1 MAG: ABC transporter permease [Sphingobacteriia bacterium]TAH09023.1 MAG: ABC transporter permease [Sphingobacteriia bacterium]
MNKIFIIIQREYLSRVKNKRFLLTTLLTPIIMVGFIAGATFLSISGKDEHKIAVIDQNGFFKSNLQNTKEINFTFPENVDTANYITKGFTDIILIPKFEGTAKVNYIIRSKKRLGLNTETSISDKINEAIEDKMLQDAGIQRSQLDSIRSKSQFAELKSMEEKGNSVQESNAALSYGIGFGSGMLIYITMFIYGAMVMRGVMEEKTNRIAEVMVSSVKPFQLMMGKIIGIGAVGLTQFFMWIILIGVLTTAAQFFIPHDVMQQVSTLQQSNGQIPTGGMVQAGDAAQKIYKLQHTMSTANWPVIISCFIFYFLGGYLFYASLFAAVGSVVNEDPQDAQSLMLPITMPIIFSFIIMSNAVQDPSTSIATWASIIPFSSPMVMMARIAYGIPGTVPYWQLGLSMLSLIGGFLLTTWLSGKIYRTGILMYGKKVSWKEMGKWAFRKN